MNLLDSAIDRLSWIFGKLPLIILCKITKIWLQPAAKVHEYIYSIQVK